MSFSARELHEMLLSLIPQALEEEGAQIGTGDQVSVDKAFLRKESFCIGRVMDESVDS